MDRADIIIKNAYIITLDPDRRVIANGYIAVKDGKITAIEAGDPPAELKSGRTIDAKKKIVFPGLINTHMHMFQTMFKGLGRDRKLLDWANASIRPGLHLMDPDICYYAALMGIIESLHSGTTTVLDYHYAHVVPDTDYGVLKAFEESGIRAILGRGKIKTEPYPAEFNVTRHETEQFYFDEVQRLWKEYRDNERIDICMAPGVIFEMSEDGFKEHRKIANETGMLITMHTMETLDDDEFSLENFGDRTVPFLEKTGVLGPDFLAVHCVALQDEDIEILKHYDVKISHNPHSNLTLGSGVAPIVRLQNEGLTVSLATDGAGSNDSQDMIEVLKLTALLQKGMLKTPSVMTAAETLETATLGGAKCIGKQDSIGSLEVGKKADLFLYDPMKNKSVPVYDPISSLIYCSGQNNVDSVMVDGKMVMENGVITTIDEEKAIWQVQKYAQELAKEVNFGNDQWGKRMPAWW